MGFTRLGFRSTSFSLDFILFLPFMNNVPVSWYSASLLDIDAKICVVLQLVREIFEKRELTEVDLL